MTNDTTQMKTIVQVSIDDGEHHPLADQVGDRHHPVRKARVPMEATAGHSKVTLPQRVQLRPTTRLAQLVGALIKTSRSPAFEQHRSSSKKAQLTRRWGWKRAAPEPEAPLLSLHQNQQTHKFRLVLLTFPGPPSPPPLPPADAPLTAGVGRGRRQLEAFTSD